jgi:hypothetical protein
MIVLFNRDVTEAFDMAKRGFSVDEIYATFARRRRYRDDDVGDWEDEYSRPRRRLSPIGDDSE